MKATKALFPQQVRFNWGFHDGTLEASWNKARRWTHVDKAYADGYQVGYDHFKLTGERPESSAAAWAEFKSAKAA